VGESFSAGAALQLAAALGALAVPRQPVARRALIASLAPTGHAAALVVGRHGEARG
jgi:hypothetical protein